MKEWDMSEANIVWTVANNSFLSGEGYTAVH